MSQKPHEESPPEQSRTEPNKPTQIAPQSTVRTAPVRPPARPPSPLQLRPLGDRGFRRRLVKDVFWGGLLLSVICLFVVAAMPRRAPLPIAALDKNGVHGVYNLKSSEGELLIYNFRAVEEGKLYRGSGFPKNHFVMVKGQRVLQPAAMSNNVAFEFLRSKGIRQVYCLDAEAEFYAQRWYFNYWSRESGYRISIMRPHKWPKHPYDQSSRSSSGFGLAAAVEFIAFMKDRDPANGAVYLQEKAGKDATGVVAAAYELWRNVGSEDPDALWEKVKARYLVSDVLIKRDKDARKLAGPMATCGDGQAAFVCAEQIDSLRTDLERIAQLH